MEVHQRSILETEMAFVGVRTVEGIRILQAEKEEADTRVVSLVGVEIQASAGNGFGVVAVLGVDMDYSEEAVAGENTSFVVVESKYSVGLVGSESRRVNWGYRPAFPSQRKDHGRAAVEEVVCRIVEVEVEGVVGTVVKVAVELVGTVPPHIGEATSRGLTNCTDSGKVAVAEVERWWKPGERS